MVLDIVPQKLGLTPTDFAYPIRGEYLYQDGNDWFLVVEGIHSLVQVMTLEPSDGVWQVPTDHQATYLFVFNLKQADLTAILGQRVVNFLIACKNSGRKFRVARPLPPEILPNSTAQAEFDIPSGCDRCLEFMRIDTNGDTRLCDSTKLKGFVFTRDGRRQLYDYLKLVSGDEF